MIGILVVGSRNTRISQKIAKSTCFGKLDLRAQMELDNKLGIWEYLLVPIRSFPGFLSTLDKKYIPLKSTAVRRISGI